MSEGSEEGGDAGTAGDEDTRAGVVQHVLRVVEQQTRPDRTIVGDHGVLVGFPFADVDEHLQPGLAGQRGQEHRMLLLAMTLAIDRQFNALTSLVVEAVRLFHDQHMRRCRDRFAVDDTASVLSVLLPVFGAGPGFRRTVGVGFGFVRGGRRGQRIERWLGVWRNDAACS